MSQCQNFPKRIKVFQEECISSFIHFFQEQDKILKRELSHCYTKQTDTQFMLFLENILLYRQMIFLLVYSKTSHVAYQDHSIWQNKQMFQTRHFFDPRSGLNKNFEDLHSYHQHRWQKIWNIFGGFKSPTVSLNWNFLNKE